MLSFAPALPERAPQQLISATVVFPQTGATLIKAVVKQGEPPRLIFQSQKTGRTLLDAKLGERSDWPYSADARSNNAPDDRNGSIRFLILHRAGLPDPLIVALAKQPRATDCTYNAAIFGEVSGHLSQLSPNLPGHFTRGEYMLSTTEGAPITLTVTSERYQSNDVHYLGPSKMEVYVYTYQPLQRMFILTRRFELNSDDLHVYGESLNLLFGTFTNC